MRCVLVLPALLLAGCEFYAPVCGDDRACGPGERCNL